MRYKTDVMEGDEHKSKTPVVPTATRTYNNSVVLYTVMLLPKESLSSVQFSNLPQSYLQPHDNRRFQEPMLTLIKTSCFSLESLPRVFRGGWWPNNVNPSQNRNYSSTDHCIRQFIVRTRDIKLTNDKN